MEERVIDLEIRYTHQEKLVAELSAVIFEQRKRIDELDERVKALEERVRAEEAGPNERPPHY